MKIGVISNNFSGCGVGAFVNGVDNLSNFQEMIGKKLAVVLIYVHWLEPFPQKEIEAIDNNGSLPLITWEPWVTHPSGVLSAIASKIYDDYVKAFIQAIKEWGKPVFLRFAHEMNGNWYPWDGYHNGQEEGAGKYRAAWVYVHNVKEELKADNIILVWCPNNTNQPNASWNAARAYYPGDRYVDWLGIDGYNWGYDRWQSFDSVFKDIYRDLTSLTQKPLMIGEFGSAEQGGSKSDWIIDAFEKIKTSYPQIKIFCWFNINKERDWRVDSSMSSRLAFKNALQDGYFLDTIIL